MAIHTNKNTMHEVTRDLLVSLAAFAAIFGIIYVFLITRHREKMSMLEKGVDPSLFSPTRGTSYTLKFGMLAVGIALGILTADLLYRNDALQRAPAYFAMTFLFGGASLILNFIVERKQTDR